MDMTVPTIEEIKRLAKASQLEYWKEREQVVSLVALMEIVPQTDIWIYTDYPDGWYAVFGGEDKVYIVDEHKGKRHLSTQPVRGFNPNGSLIFDPNEMMMKRLVRGATKNY